MKSPFQWRSTSDLPAFGARLLEFSHPDTEVGHFHIETEDDQSSLLLGIPSNLEANNGVAHVLEHMLLAGRSATHPEHRFFGLQAASGAVAMNATTCSRYMALHFTCDSPEVFLWLQENYINLLRTYEFSPEQFAVETGGVVANEMRGYYTNLDWFLRMSAHRAIYTDGPKSRDAGGDPALISKLSPQALNDHVANRFGVGQFSMISAGAIDPVVVQGSAELATLLAGTRQAIGPKASSVADQRVQLSIEADQKSPLLVTVTWRLTAGDSPDQALDAFVLGELIRNYRSEIEDSIRASGLDIFGSLQCDLYEGDSMVSVIFDGDRDVDPGDLLADSLLSLIHGLPEGRLGQLVRSSVASFVMPGGARFGAGVDLSLRLFESLIESGGVYRPEGLNHDVAGSVKRLANVEYWKKLIDQGIRFNGACSIVRSTPATGRGNAGFARMADFPSVPETRGDGSDTLPPLSAFATNVLSIADTSWGGRLHQTEIPGTDTLLINMMVPLPSAGKAGELCTEIGALVELLKSVCPGMHSTIVRRRRPAHLVQSFLRLMLPCFVTYGPDYLSKLLEAYRSGNWLEGAVSNADDQPGGMSGLHIYAMSVAADSLFVPSDRSDNRIKATQQCKDDVEAGRVIFFLSGAGMETGLLDRSFASYPPLDPKQLRSRHQLEEPVGDWMPPKPASQTVPGDIGHRARVWTLPDGFVANGECHAALVLLGSLVTSLHLEPVVREQGGAYASAAEVRQDLGVLGMYSFRDPGVIDTDAVFLEAIKAISDGRFTDLDFERARRRSLGKVTPQGRVHDRDYPRFEDWLFDASSPDFSALRSTIIHMDRARFLHQARDFLQHSRSNRATLTGQSNR